MDFGDLLFIQLTVNGFEDANGNPIAATMLAPGTNDLDDAAVGFPDGCRDESGTKALPR